MSGAPGTVRVLRGGTVESVHRVHAVAVDDSGRTVAAVGDPSRTTWYRSAAKPFQALPLVADGAADRLGLTDDELALCCASHSGEPGHVETARRILERAGVDEARLACGPQLPIGVEAGRALLLAGGRPARIHNNCSGKHAGMLALAADRGWPLEGYHEPDHPVQRRMLAEVARWSDMEEGDVTTGVDGCGVVCFAVPLRSVALAFARLGAAADRGEAGPARVVGAMTGRPWMVAGTGRLCTELMDATAGRLFAKTGAEGVYGAGAPGAGLGIALKVEDGARRASEPALLRVLDALGLLEDADPDRLARFARPVVRNTRDEEVGVLRADFEVETR